MPLIALSILKTKIKELLLVIAHLRDENLRLKSMLDSKEDKTPSPEAVFELETLRAKLDKYKKERSYLYGKISGLIKKVDEIIEKRRDG